MRILLLEDEESDAKLIERWLAVHDVVNVSHAADAIAMMRYGFDLIICDMGLPDATTITESATSVTEILAASQIPLIKISGRPGYEVIDKTCQAILDAIAALD